MEIYFGSKKTIAAKVSFYKHFNEMHTFYNNNYILLYLSENFMLYLNFVKIIFIQKVLFRKIKFELSTVVL